MAYDRTRRFFRVSCEETGPDVSPNSYQTAYNNYCTCKGTNWAPFLVCAGRTTKKASDGPAPNAYYPKIPKSTIGGSSPHFTEPRFPEKPCGQEPEGTDENKGTQERVKGYMYRCHVPYTMLGYPPTIPNPGHMGYKILEDRTMVECCHPDHDTTLGPAYYHVNYSTFCSCYKGSYWSRYSKRTPIGLTDTPGVGTYNIVPEPNPLEEYINKLRHERKKHACSLRYLDQLENQAIKNNYPAPNQYASEKVKCVKVKKKIVPKRLVRPRKPYVPPQKSPAPNTYTDPRTAFEYLTKPSFRKGLNAFLSNAPRFPGKGLEVRPGPGDYYLQSFVDEMAKKVSPYAVRNTAFDTSIPKKLYYLPRINWEEVFKCPEYGLKPKPPPPPPPPPPVHPFASKTKRFPKTDVLDLCYDIRPGFSYLHEKKSFRKSTRYNFLVNEKRFARMTNFAVVEDKGYIPGLIYNLVKYKSKRINNASQFGKAERFIFPKNVVPGPLQYNPRVSSKKNFNVSLGGSAPHGPMQVYRMKLKQKPVTELFVKKTTTTSEKSKECPEVQPVKIEFTR